MLDLDRTAIGLSLVCLAHCLLIPVGLAVLPALGTSLVDTETAAHWVLLALALPVSILAIILASRRHRDVWVISLAFIGLTALFIGVSHLFGHELEAVLSITGAGLVLVAHIRNWRLSKIERTPYGEPYGKPCGEPCEQSGGKPSPAA
jgi:hypothetical protein